MLAYVLCAVHYDFALVVADKVRSTRYGILFHSVISVRRCGDIPLELHHIREYRHRYGRFSARIIRRVLDYYMHVYSARAYRLEHLARDLGFAAAARLDLIAYVLVVREARYRKLQIRTVHRLFLYKIQRARSARDHKHFRNLAAVVIVCRLYEYRHGDRARAHRRQKSRIRDYRRARAVDYSVHYLALADVARYYDLIGRAVYKARIRDLGVRDVRAVDDKPCLSIFVGILNAAVRKFGHRYKRIVTARQCLSRCYIRARVYLFARDLRYVHLIVKYQAVGLYRCRGLLLCPVVRQLQVIPFKFHLPRQDVQLE